MIRTIRLRPSPRGYAGDLRVIMEQSTRAEDRAWAREELARIQPLLAANRWGDENEIEERLSAAEDADAI